MELERKFYIGNDQSVYFVGLVCLDIINVMDFFPKEDIGQRCEDCLWQRGGNAGNSATVFSLLNGKAHFVGTLSSTQHTAFLTDDLSEHGVAFDKCVTVQSSSCPMSCIILNRSAGTRTVLHTNKNLRELSIEDFTHQIDLSAGDVGWIHFEGRDNALEISKMLSHVNQFNSDCVSDSSTKKIITSLEAEKLRFAKYMNDYNMWTLPDVLFVSKDFARCQGYDDMNITVQAYKLKVKEGAIVICAWGEEGAAAFCPNEGLVVSPAFPPEKVIDTCGAGDTFNGAVIRALSQGKSLQEAIIFGCRIAGAKCGNQGFDQLKELYC